MRDALLQVRNLVVEYHDAGEVQCAVDNVSFTLARGEVLGVVGESGCGKSSLAKALLRLQESRGEIVLDELRWSALDGEALRRERQRMQAVFQDPRASLNPRRALQDIITEPLTVRATLAVAERKKLAQEWLARVGLDPSLVNRYPQELSGGQCQRVAIARALIAEPDVLVLDEPVSALDMSIRGQLLGLLAQLQRELSVAMIFIAHDMTAVRYLCNRVMVMYAGRAVEIADTESLFESPAHPYTRQLLEAVLPPDPARQPRADGRFAEMQRVATGCAFANRCREVMEICAVETPQLEQISTVRECACHSVRAHRAD